MKLSVSFKDLENHKSVEKEMENAVKKLNVLLKTYQPDLVQLHAVFAKLPRNDEHTLTLNLTLPTGTLHATASSEHLGACCKKAFHEIESQVKKHKSLLRKDFPGCIKNLITRLFFVDFRRPTSFFPNDHGATFKQTFETVK